jgi:hypothetical protein
MPNITRAEIERRVRATGVLDLEGANLSGLNLPMLFCETNQHPKINLSKANLEEVNLTGADLSGANLFGTNFRNARLEQARLRAVTANTADFEGANCRTTDFALADLGSADFCHANMAFAFLCGASLYSADIQGADLRCADLSKTFILSHDDHTVLAHAKLIGTNLDGANLRGVDCQETDFTDAFIGDADLRGANLEYAVFFHTRYNPHAKWPAGQAPSGTLLVPKGLHVSKIDASAKDELNRTYRSTTDANERTFYQMVMLAIEGYSVTEIAQLTFFQENTVVNCLTRTSRNQTGAS